MQESMKKQKNNAPERQYSLERQIATGLCIGCGHKVSLCGRPFTADIECSKCNSINKFRNSQQPVNCRSDENHVSS